MAVETFSLTDTLRGLQLEGSYTYDDASLDITRVDWQNTGSIAARLEVIPDGRDPVDVTVTAGASGTVRGGRLNGYRHGQVVVRIAG